jgi:hypothetical protein
MPCGQQTGRFKATGLLPLQAIKLAPIDSAKSAGLGTSPITKNEYPRALDCAATSRSTAFGEEIEVTIILTESCNLESLTVAP